MAVQDEVPKSRTTIYYKTEIEGEPASVELPHRLLVCGDFSHGKSKDRKVDLDERKVRNFDGKNTDHIIKDMEISFDASVPNKINPESEEKIKVQLKIKGLESFSPKSIANQVPQIRSLLLMKKLLEEIQSNIANKKEFSQLLSRLYSNPKSLDQIKQEIKNYATTLPTPKVEVIDSKEETE